MHSGKTQPNWIKEDNGHNFRKSKRTELENIIHHKEDKLANGPRETSQRKQKSRNISNETWIIQTECVPLKCRWDAIGLENTRFSFLPRIQNVAKNKILSLFFVLDLGNYLFGSHWQSRLIFCLIEWILLREAASGLILEARSESFRWKSLKVPSWKGFEIILGMTVSEAINWNLEVIERLSWEGCRESRATEPFRWNCGMVVG